MFKKPQSKNYGFSLCENPAKLLPNYFKRSHAYVDIKAIGKVGFLTEATCNTKHSNFE